MTDLAAGLRPDGRDHLDDEVISALLDGELPAGDRIAAEGHRAGCPRCRHRSEQLARVASVLSGPPRPRPHDVADAVRAALAGVPDPVRVALAGVPDPAGDRTIGQRHRRHPRPAAPGRTRAPRARLLAGSAVVVAAVGLAAVGLVVGGSRDGSPDPGPVRSVVLASSLGSYPSSGSLRATLAATVGAIDSSGPAAAPDATATVPCHRVASRAAELAAATAAVPLPSAAGGPEASFAAPLELTDVPAEVFTFPRLAVDATDGPVARVGTWAVVVADGTCQVMARLDW